MKLFGYPFAHVSNAPWIPGVLLSFFWVELLLKFLTSHPPKFARNGWPWVSNGLDNTYSGFDKIICSLFHLWTVLYKITWRPCWSHFPLTSSSSNGFFLRLVLKIGPNQLNYVISLCDNLPPKTHHCHIWKLIQSTRT